MAVSGSRMRLYFAIVLRLLSATLAILATMLFTHALTHPYSPPKGPRSPSATVTTAAPHP